MWTENRCDAPGVKEWTHDDVFCWAKNIDDISDDVADVFVKSEITGNELVTLKKYGLMMIGITQRGTLCLLLEDIEMLKKASQDIVTLTKHSPYCFGKIMDHLRLSCLHSQQGFAGEPALPTVCDSRKNMLEKMVE
jgi:hypothetical protein